MKKVCGTCNYQINSRVGKSGIEVRCAHDNKWRKDNSPDCGKWIEYIHKLSPQNRISIVDSERKESLAIEANSFAREANNIARLAASHAARASRWAIYAVIITAIMAIMLIKNDIFGLISWLFDKIFKAP